MATTAEGQAKLRKMLAAGMGRQQALNMLINAQKKTTTPTYKAVEPNPPAEGWTWDDERGGWTPPASDEGSSVTVPELGKGIITRPDGTQTPIAPGAQPVTTPVAAAAKPTWSVYEDPVYMQQLQGAQSAFNRDRINALTDKERATLGINQTLQDRKSVAEESRRRLAGNFAARGMAGGRAGALSREEAQMNARELRLRTDLRDQISELNRQFVANYGAKPEDWLGTTRGASAQQDAVQAAINARLAGLTSVG